MSAKSVDGKEIQEKEQPKIMTKPLPVILDELDDYIKRVEEAVRQANIAVKESREAAAQARLAGEKAGEAAKKAAETAVAKVREEAATALAKAREEAALAVARAREEAAKANDALNKKVMNTEADLRAEIEALYEKAKQEAFALDSALLAAKESHLEESPFLKK
jgi:colicin import membrane protein